MENTISSINTQILEDTRKYLLAGHTQPQILEQLREDYPSSDDKHFEAIFNRATAVEKFERDWMSKTFDSFNLDFGIENTEESGALGTIILFYTGKKSDTKQRIIAITNDEKLMVFQQEQTFPIVSSHNVSASSSK